MTDRPATTLSIIEGYVVIKRPGSKETKRMSIEGILRATGVLEKDERVDWVVREGGKARP